MAELKKLVARRKVTRTRVTASFNQSNAYDSFSPQKRALEKSCLLNAKEDLLNFDKLIQDIQFNDVEEIDERLLDIEMDNCEEYLDKIRQCLFVLNSYPDSGSISHQLLDNARSILKQPVAPLPTFSGEEEEDLVRFLTEFELTTACYKYPDRDLLLLLRQQLSGKARTLINSLEADKQTFKDAKRLLESAFASPENRKFAAMKQLTQLRLGYEDDPFEFISKLKMLQESVKSLDIKSEDFVQYFAWNGMNDRFKTHLTQVTLKSKPSIREIVSKFFEAHERYALSQKNFQARKFSKNENKGKSSSSFAVSVKEKTSSNFRMCVLCRKTDKSPCEHPIYRCPKFNTPKLKLEQLERLKGCTKCASFEHVASSCKFKFKRKCDSCSRWHFRFLCPQWSAGSHDSENRNDSAAKPTEASSGVVVLQNVTCDAVLPTFSFEVKGKHFRALKDEGSQSSFTTRSFAESKNLKVIKDNVKVIVNGFNKPQAFLTKLVEMPVKLGDIIYQIPSLVVPELKVKLDLPKLNQVVKGFKEKGYVMADSFLGGSNSIENIDFILGANAAYCLPGSDICFGKRSMYVSSTVGVLLSGEIDRYLADLSSLPFNSTVTDSLSLAVEQDGADSRCGEECSVIDVFQTHSFFISPFLPSIDCEEFQDLPYEALVTDSNLAVLDRKGKVVDSLLHKATDEILEAECAKFINYDNNVYNDESVEIHDTLVKFTLNNLNRNEEGRITVPLLWNGRVSNYLSKNEKLSRLILNSNRKRLNPEQIKLIDQAINDQVKDGIIEIIPNIDQYLEEHPQYSFLPHMGVFRPEKETTKCRVVFLSNLCENKGKFSLSHNQSMYAGPTLNQKLSSAFLQVRFGSNLLLYDLRKAFNQLELSDTDSAKLLFYWFKNVEKGDFSTVVYKNNRLSFGLRCSPFLLMISLYYILVMETNRDSSQLKDLKHLMYNLLYMDNGAIASDSIEQLRWAYGKLRDIFSPYQFDVQQVVTNDFKLQEVINGELSENPAEVVKLFGLEWNRKTDTINAKQINLESSANTKRLILKSIASQFDIFNFSIPILNRSRLFMHSLQCEKDLGWDTELPPNRHKEWVNICKQANSTPPINIKRFVGPRGGTYKLYAYTDASHVLYGCVIYILHVETDKLSFLSAKNRMVNTQLKNKSIPALELNAIALGVENLIEVYKDLSGPQCLKPINISELRLYTDSICCLHWLHLEVDKLDKLQKRTAFVINRLKIIQRLCDIKAVTFNFISGNENPADCVTRCLSYKLLQKSSFLAGPDTGKSYGFGMSDMQIIIPNPLIGNSDILMANSNVSLTTNLGFSLLDPSNFSSFRGLVLLYRRVLACIQKWKLKVGIPCQTSVNLFAESIKQIIISDQRKYFASVFYYFLGEKNKLEDIPAIVSQMNVFIDDQGLLRVKSKFKKWHNDDGSFPILLHQHSDLTRIIILDSHECLGHSGCYSVLAQLRKQFFFPKHFSTVKKCLKSCVHCRRFNARSIKLNQSHYREFRTEPPQVPFANIFIDHLGPFTVKKNAKNEKIWLLCVTCTWSRALNLKICHDLSLKEFLRAFQLHCFEYGVPQLCVSDLGSQFSAGFNLLSDFLRDPEVQVYFETVNVKPLSFQQYFKGCSQLGSLVEICVKLVKRLLFGCIKNNILSFHDFEFIVAYVVHLANKRPVAFKEGLRESDLDSVPEPITPELLIRGYDLTSLNLIPNLQEVPADPNWTSKADPSCTIKDEYDKLRKIRSEIIEKYQEEFLSNLVAQAVDRKARYQPVIHKMIKKGDIVLLKETNVKPNHYPMGIVKEIVVNESGEVTGALVLKGRTGEIVKRHSTTLIPLLRSNEKTIPVTQHKMQENMDVASRPMRKAAVLSREKTKAILKD